MTAGDAGRADRIERYRRGHVSELIAAAALMAKGYRILARRYRASAGEIDIVARRGRRLAFVEVKARASRAAAEASLKAGQALRIRRAADQWLARYPGARELAIGFDAVLVIPWRWPIHIVDALQK